MPVDASWTFAPAALAGAATYGFVYARRWRAARAAAGPRGASGWRAAATAGGLLAALAAVVSPVDRLGEQLATMHMVQHLLLADLAAIGLLLGLTKVILRPATRRLTRLERALGPLAHPAVGVLAYVGAMWLWHVPALYDAALAHEAVHLAEHASFALAGGVYWWFILSPIRSRLRLGGLGPVMYMASTKILVGFLGLLLAFSPALLYDAYADRGRTWGMTPLDDQQVAGLVMALEQSIVMGIALALLFARMLTESDREDERSERLEQAG